MIVTTDSVLGDVRRDDCGSLFAEILHRGRRVKLHLMANDDREPSKCIGVASAVVADLGQTVDAARLHAAQELVELANDWREDDDSDQFDAPRLQALFQFDGMLVYEDGVVEIFFTDGDVFAGHAVITNFSRDRGFFNARFEG